MCVGHFRQLLPAPNNAYNDNGRYAFQSDLWNSAMSHLVMLSARKRQTKELSEYVNKLLCSTIDETTRVFMANLQRPLPSSSMGKNSAFVRHKYGVDKHDEQEIKNLPGQTYILKVGDTGDQHALKKCPLLSSLKLKKIRH